MARIAPALEQFCDLPEPQRVLGPFRLIRRIGKGGFAPVWQAIEAYGETELRTVAIKLFAVGERMQSGTQPVSQSVDSRFRRDQVIAEARSLCQVEHPNVVRFHAITTDSGGAILGLVMEYVQGRALDSLIETKGKLSVAETLEIGVSVASALAAVHRVGLVHRDVKPANVIESAGVYKLIDFGIAAADRPRGAAGATKEKPKKKQAFIMDDLPIEAMTRTSQLGGTDATDATGHSGDAAIASGTMGYIDPVCYSELTPATAASDLYSLGAMLFECVTGKLPSVAGAATGFDMEIMDGRRKAPSARAIATQVPAPLAALIDKCLDPDPRARPRSAEAVTWELERIRRDIAGHTRPLPPEDIGPFRGLGRFEEADREVYFGRAIEVAASLEMLRTRGLLALVGSSGSGKSSLARAGVLPIVAEGALGGWPKQWDSIVCVPGIDAHQSLIEAIAPHVPNAAKLEPEALVHAIAERVQTQERGLVILVDQLEELTTLSSGPSQAFVVRFLARLGALVTPGLRAVVAARRDLLDSLLALKELGPVLTRGTLLVNPMDDATWGIVLDQALGAYGYELEDAALRDELLAELKGTATAMPLVQFALTQLWQQRDKQHKKLTRAGLRDIGGIAGALERHAEATLSHITDHNPDALEVAHGVLLALTTAQGTRALRTNADLKKKVPSPHLAGVLEKLEDARLIVRDAEGLTLAHEALLNQWRRLRSWVAEAREDRLLAEEIEHAAAQYTAAGHDASLLWRKRRLVAGEDLGRRGRVDLSDAARSFIAAGRRQERTGRVLILTLAAMVIAAGSIFAVISIKRYQTAALDAQDKERHWREAEVIAQQNADDALTAAKKAKVAEANANSMSAINQELKDTADEKLKKAIAETERLCDTKVAEQIKSNLKTVGPRSGGPRTNPTAAGPTAEPTAAPTMDPTGGDPPAR